MARSKSTLAPISWTSDDNKLIWSLLAELEKKENHGALYGVQKGNKTLGSTKTKIHKEIARVLFLDQYSEHEDTLASRVKSKIEDLYSTYKKHVKRLTGTGGGLGGNDDASQDPEGVQEGEEEVRCYIGPAGPDVSTSQDAKNLWDKIHQEFMFFGTMHRYLATRPNAIPPVVTTGVGRYGRQVIQYQKDQPASETHSSDPAASATSSEEGSPPTTPVPPAPSSNATPPPASTPLTNDKENNARTSSGRKSTPKGSSFKLNEMMNKAKSSVHRVPKRSFEDKLADITESSFKQANARANSAHRIEKRRLALDQLAQIGRERDQVLSMHREGIFPIEDIRDRLRKLDERQALLEDTMGQSQKRARVRSPSPSIHSSPLVRSSSLPPMTI